MVLGVQSLSIPFNHRSFQKPDPFSLGFWRFSRTKNGIPGFRMEMELAPLELWVKYIYIYISSGINDHPHLKGCFSTTAHPPTLPQYMGVDQKVRDTWGYIGGNHPKGKNKIPEMLKVAHGQNCPPPIGILINPWKCVPFPLQDSKVSKAHHHVQVLETLRVLPEEVRLAPHPRPNRWLGSLVEGCPKAQEPQIHIQTNRNQSKPIQTDPNRSRPIQTNPNRSKPIKPIQTDPNRFKPIQTDPNRSKPIQTDPNRSKPIQTDPNRSKPIQTDPNRSKPTQTDPNRSKPIQTDPKRSKLIQTDPNRSKPIQSDPKRSKPIQTDPNRSKPIQTNPNQSKPSNYVLPETCSWHITSLPSCPIRPLANCRWVLGPRLTEPATCEVEKHLG